MCTRLMPTAFIFYILFLKLCIWQRIARETGFHNVFRTYADCIHFLYIISEAVYMAAYRYGTGALYLENIGVRILKMDR